MIGDVLAGPVGGALGGAAQRLFSRVTGLGDYQVRTNSLMGVQDGSKVSNMMFNDLGQSSIRVQKREFLGTIECPAINKDFNQERYLINPCDENSFPWLSHIAPLFTEWCLKGAIITFETTSSVAAVAGGGLGTIAIATQYNVAENEFEDMEHMLQSPYRTSGNPAQTLVHGIECDPELQSKEALFTRREGLNHVNAPNLYDHCLVTVATEGLSSVPGTVHGRLYVSYDIELRLALLPSSAHVGRPLSLINSSSSLKDTSPIGDVSTLTNSTFQSFPTYRKSHGFLDLAKAVAIQAPMDGISGRPTEEASRTAELMYWMNESIDKKTAYIGFMRPGNYQLVISCLSPPSLKPAAQFGVLPNGIRQQNGQGILSYPPPAPEEKVNEVVNCESPDGTVEVCTNLFEFNTQTGVGYVGWTIGFAISIERTAFGSDGSPPYIALNTVGTATDAADFKVLLTRTSTSPFNVEAAAPAATIRASGDEYVTMDQVQRFLKNSNIKLQRDSDDDGYTVLM